MAINTPSFNPNQPVPNEPFVNDNKEFLIQTGDKMMNSGPLEIDGRNSVANANDLVGDIDCGVLNA
jgi:hypothetical protein